MLVQSFLEDTAARTPDKLALVAGGERLTYGEIDARANRLAHALIAHGVERGDRVAAYLDNSVEAVVSLWAILKAGGVFMLLNPTLKAGKLAYVLNDSRAKALITDADKLGRVTDDWSALPHVSSVLVAGGPGAAAASGKVFADLAEEMARQPRTRPERRCIDVDLAALIYTSGSTGDPKGVMSAHRNMDAASHSIITYLGNAPEEVILSCLPLSFDYGLYQLLMCTRFGGTLVLEKGFTFPAAVLNKIAAEKVTGFPLVPTMLAMLLRMDLSKFDLSSLRYVSNTGAALPVEHIRRLRALLPHLTVFSMYGLTECKRASYLPPEQIDRRPDSIGRGMPNCELYLVDDDGNRLPNPAQGELVVRGANVMSGYWEKPEATAKVYRPGPVPGERVLHTGDTFRSDADGFFYFVGRRDEMIKSRGERVSPKEVENVLAELDGVAEAAVVGVPDPVLGAAVKAVLVCRPGASLSERDVLRHCTARLEDFAIPRIVEFRDRLPLGGTGKVDKKALVEPYAPAQAA
jgi:long-chain acyl-CoA synthetase